MSSPLTYVLPRLAQHENSSGRTHPELNSTTAARGRPASSIRLAIWLSVTYSWRSEGVILMFCLDPSRHNLSRLQGSYTDPTAQWESNFGTLAVTFKPTADGFMCILLAEMSIEHHCFSFIVEKTQTQ